MLTIWYNIFYNRFDSIIPRKIIFDKEITFGYTIFIWNKRSSYIILNNILIMSNPSIIFRYSSIVEIEVMPRSFSINGFRVSLPDKSKVSKATFQTSVYKGYKQDKIEMRGDRAEMSDFPLYLNTVAGGLDRRDQTIGGFSFVVKIYAVPVVEIIG